ncbi:MAG: peptidoglycan-binding protein LysM, partial [Maricaulis sp.]|nr:peptidoglycan-binding protein LysM [Maricaulis sp.]
MTATRSFIIAAVLAVLAIAAAVYFFARPGSEPVTPAPVETAADNSDTISNGSEMPSLLAPP